MRVLNTTLPFQKSRYYCEKRYWEGKFVNLHMINPAGRQSICGILLRMRVGI